MVPINMAGMSKKKWSKSLSVVFNVNVFATPNARPDKRTNTIHCIDPCVTHMDQKGNKNKKKEGRKESKNN